MHLVVDNLSLEQGLRSPSQNQRPEGEGGMAKEGCHELQSKVMLMPPPQVPRDPALPWSPHAICRKAGWACCTVAEQGGNAAAGRAAGRAADTLPVAPVSNSRQPSSCTTTGTGTAGLMSASLVEVPRTSHPPSKPSPLGFMLWQASSNRATWECRKWAGTQGKLSFGDHLFALAAKLSHVPAML